MISSGIMHFLEALIGRSRLLLNIETCDASKVDWNKLDSQGDNVIPIPCHSHNDYQRPRPLYDALRWGCTSVEADVWLLEDELLVGHDASTIRSDLTLRKMYLEPLEQLLDERNRPSALSDDSIFGVFKARPSETLVLLIDFKQSSKEAFDVVYQQLGKLRSKDYLSYWNGYDLVSRPVTVVLSGEAPFRKIAEATGRRDVFYDAPLDVLEVSSNTFNVTNAYYASTNFRTSVGQVWLGHLLPGQMREIRGRIQTAHALGLKARYWSTPAWPVSLRNHVWHVLMKEGADVLNVDDLKA